MPRLSSRAVRLAGRLEWLEQAGDLAGGDDLSAVGDLQLRVAVADGDLNADLATWVVVADGVVDQVGSQPCEQAGVAGDWRGGDRGAHGQPARRGFRFPWV